MCTAFSLPSLAMNSSCSLCQRPAQTTIAPATTQRQKSAVNPASALHSSNGILLGSLSLRSRRPTRSRKRRQQQQRQLGQQQQKSPFSLAAAKVGRCLRNFPLSQRINLQLPLWNFSTTSTSSSLPRPKPFCRLTNAGAGVFRADPNLIIGAPFLFFLLTRARAAF